MRRLLGLAILGLAIYFVATEVLPQLQNRMDRLGDFHPGTTGGDVATCVAHARDANSGVIDVLRSVRPGSLSRDGWERRRRRLDSMITGAERFCLCHLPACDHASQALDILRQQVDDFEAAVAGRGAPLNAGRTQARIERLLERAESAAHDSF
jgi:hypothetical protein